MYRALVILVCQSTEDFLDIKVWDVLRNYADHVLTVYRPRALFAIANALRVVERGRVSEAIFEAVKAANSSEGFVGEGGVITQTINSKNVISVIPQDVPDFDIEEIFGALANEDYEATVQLARGFQGEAPRTNATIAIARSVLNQKPARVPSR